MQEYIGPTKHLAVEKGFYECDREREMAARVQPVSWFMLMTYVDAFAFQ